MNGISMLILSVGGIIAVLFFVTYRYQDGVQRDADGGDCFLCTGGERVHIPKYAVERPEANGERHV